MKTLFAFLKKEWMEQIRSGRLFQLAVVLAVVCVAVSIPIMNKRAV